MDIRQKPPASIRTLLEKDAGTIGMFLRHIELLQGLEQRLLSFLAPPLNKHCVIANYANDILVLHTDAPAWASRIRYNTPSILQFLQFECKLATLKTIRIKVMPVTFRQDHSPDKSWRLDTHTAGLIRQAAETISDEPLKHVLQKISRHGHDGSQ